MKRIFKKITFALIALLILLATAWLFRTPILRSIGNLLIYEDPMENVPALFVLSGNPWDRGNEAVRLYKAGFAEKVICTGENIPTLFLITGILYPESELTQSYIISEGVPSGAVELLCKGTSTKEEADYILEYCKQRGIDKLVIVSSKFHTRRIKKTFKKSFEREGLELIIRGAPSSSYDESRWWESEEGLIFVNNEYIKIAYYWWKGF